LALSAEKPDTVPMAMLFRSHTRRKRRAVAMRDFENACCTVSPQWFTAGPTGASSVIDMFGVGLDGSKTIVVGRRPDALVERAWGAVGSELRRCLIADGRTHPDGNGFLQGVLFDPNRYAVES